ncbi:DUF4386 domain-containing protein [Georgenia deserti]|uniref:DUF4386 domain-containing protein n=1 Tax=Georgenia deserti TaxID=2093781 RepID=A0ABW4L6G0_9MICO
MTHDLPRSTARTTGLLYLSMALVAVPGFLVIRPLLYDPDSASATLANLVENEGLARLGVGLELALVVAQTLTALWFARLFVRVDAAHAAAVGVFGVINAVCILASAATLAAALDIALGNGLAAGYSGAAAQLMYVLGGHLWGVGGVFFGLWLIPMGLLVLRAGMTRVLGWLLVAGGAGYLVSTATTYLAPGLASAGEILTYVASVGEFWMIGLLCWYGFRRSGAPSAVPPGGVSGPTADGSELESAPAR